MKSFVYDRQIFFMCLISVLGIGIFGIAHTGAAELSTGAWLAAAANSVIFCTGALILCFIMRRNEGATLYDISVKAAGRAAGEIFSFLFALFYLIFSGLAVSYFSHIVSAWILPNTSYRLIAALICFTCAAAMSKNFTSIIRLTGFLGVITVFTLIAIRAVMVFYGDTSNLEPIAEPEVVQNGLLSALTQCSPFFFGIGVLAVIPQSSQNKHSVLVSAGAVLFAGAVLVLICEACISVLGPVQTALYPDAMLLSMKAFDISRFTFIQRADIIFIITWTLLLLPASCCICSIPHVYLKRKFGEKSTRTCAYIIAAAVFILANTMSGISQALGCMTALCKTAGTVLVFIFPIIILILSEVRKHGKV